MLGEPIGEESGKITARRVLPSDGHGPKVEVSFQASGRLLGDEATALGTYWSVLRSDGTLYGEGQGIVMTKNGDVATWTGQGVGKLTGRGMAASWRGAIYYQTPAPKLARLNGIAAIFEFEADENDNTRAKVWEWR